VINTEKSEICNQLGCDAVAKGYGTFCSFQKIREPTTEEKTRLGQRSLCEKEEFVYSKVGLQIEKEKYINLCIS
jgi:hypothetical protein